MSIEQVLEMEMPNQVRFPGGQVSWFSFLQRHEGYGSSDPLEQIAADLKGGILYDESGFNLVPLNALDSIEAACVFRDVFGDGELRAGYLPTTPTEFSQVLPLIDKWKLDPHSIYYIFGNEVPRQYGGYLSLDFDFVRGSENEVQAWLTYGILHGKRREGMTTKALSLVIQAIDELNLNRGDYPIKKIVTTVSDGNIASVKILARNGFQIDNTQEVKPSPLVMGGISYLMVRWL